MSRFVPTTEERAAGSALFDFLRQAGHDLIDEDFDDRPDLTYKLNGHYMGCEIVGMIPADMQQAIRTFSKVMFRREVDVAKITIPIEPDMWMQTAIERKWAKVQKYPLSKYTKNLSLLVHYPMLGPHDPVEYDRDEFIDGVCYGQSVASHGFKNIFYWSGKKIYLLNYKKPSAPRVMGDLSKGYPCYCIYIMSAGAEGLEERFKDRQIPLQMAPDRVKHIKPLDPAYRNLKPHEPEGDLRFELDFKASPI
ncbi:hypothetical protein [Massilia sp.]|uniref:hypothetical protein n=1 Tax=Massilia sp. TaxID=1882437 RepID=UPI0028A03049|nr:hypothetical protein [Massilia sp.]